MKIICWNVNGIRSVINKNELYKYIDKHDPDIFFISEIKLSLSNNVLCSNIKNKYENYHIYFNICKRKRGYSGTCLFTKIKPISIKYGMGIKKHDQEGRLITAEYDNFIILHSYTPNSGQKLERLKYRTQEWEPDFRNYLSKLKKEKPIIICGDLNCAHKEIDIHNPKNKKRPGFTNEERTEFEKLLTDLNVIDIFRETHKSESGHYTYWSYFANSRRKNKGWRIDYFLVDKRLEKNVRKVYIHEKKMGSDHAPIVLETKNIH